jgi:PilS N terminal
MNLSTRFSFSKSLSNVFTPIDQKSKNLTLSACVGGLSGDGSQAQSLQALHRAKLQAQLHAQRGYTNIQLAIGVLVSVVAVLGAIGGFTYVTQAKVNNQLNYLADLKNSTGRLFLQLGSATASASTLVNLNTYGFFPSSTVTGTGASLKVSNQWGGGVTVAQGTAGVLGDSIAYTFSGVPGDACVAIGLGVDAVADVVTIDGVTTKAYGASTVPATVTGSTACASTQVGGHTFVFTIKG